MDEWLSGSGPFLCTQSTAKVHCVVLFTEHFLLFCMQAHVSTLGLNTSTLKKKEKRFLLSTVLDTGSGKPLEPVAVVSVIAPI